MQTAAETALERAVSALTPEQAISVLPDIGRAFWDLPGAHRQALLVGERLTVWVSMMTYDPAVARRYALRAAGETLPPVPEEQPKEPPEQRFDYHKKLTGDARKWLSREILARQPGQLQQLEAQLARLMLVDGWGSSLSRHAIETQLGEYGMAALRVTRCFKRVGSGQIRLAFLSCPLLTD